MKSVRGPAIGLTLSAAAVLLTLSMVEILLRTGLVSPRKVKTTEIKERPRSRMSDPDFRDPAFTLEAKADAFRIVVVGDSFAWGDGVHYEDAFPAKLESRLNEATPGVVFEVINWSRPGWNTARQVRSLEENLEELRPHLLVLGFVLNDPEPTAREELNQLLSPVERRSPATGISTWMFAKSRLYALIWTRLENRRTHRELSSFYRNLFSGESWETCRRALKRMRNLARKQEVRMVMTVFPVFDSPMDERYLYTDLHRQVSEEGASLRMPVLDLLDIYAGMDTRRLAVVPFSDPHPSEIAHRVAADAISDFLIRRHLIPRIDSSPKQQRPK